MQCFLKNYLQSSGIMIWFTLFLFPLANDGDTITGDKDKNTMSYSNDNICILR